MRRRGQWCCRNQTFYIRITPISSQGTTPSFENINQFGSFLAMAFLLLPFFLSSLLVSYIDVLAQTGSNVTVGDSITAGIDTTAWVVSASGDFSFGFLQLKKETKDLFLLSIWYAKIPDKTVLWYANKNNPAPKGSKVEITADHGLLLTAPDGSELWKPDNLNGTVAGGTLTDAGNFVLEDKKRASVWETFKDPRDTLLPSQILDRGAKLSSRLRETNFSRGRFEALFQEDGNLVFYSINLPSDYANQIYNASGTVASDTSTATAGLQWVFNKSGDMYILRKNGENFDLSNGERPASQSYLRATLDFDGVFTLYQHPKTSFGNETWTSLWSIPDNMCLANLVSTGSGTCGYNSICTLNANQRPICHCPRGYSLLDPNDPYSACKPDFLQGCEADALSGNTKDLYEFDVLIDTDWPLSDYVLLRPFTEEACKQSCMEDCMCAVAIFRLGDSCWKKKLPLSNGKVDHNYHGAKAFIKVRKDNSTLIGPAFIKKNSHKTLILVESVLLGSSAFLNFILIAAVCLALYYIYHNQRNIVRLNRRDSSQSTVKTNLLCFAYQELLEATNGFKEEIGRGAFGVVYKGVINIDSKIHVAVKKLNTFLLQDTEKEFKNEVNAIAQTHHKNLVRLLGFCDEGEGRLLVYEYMSNGTLASLLFNKQKPNWHLRLHLAFGIARGLLYLHEECSKQIIHCDIKPENILVDDLYNARISNFGLAKLLNMNQSQTSTAIRGTKGYVALEWFSNMPITAKVDVYSFGVVLLEIICCRRCVNLETGESEKAILTDWAYDCYREGILDALVEDDKEALDDKKCLEKLVMVALWCVQDEPAFRPTMGKVIQMLEGLVEVPIPPCPSATNLGQELC